MIRTRFPASIKEVMKLGLSSNQAHMIQSKLSKLMNNFITNHTIMTKINKMKIGTKFKASKMKTLEYDNFLLQ